MTILLYDHIELEDRAAKHLKAWKGKNQHTLMTFDKPRRALRKTKLLQLFFLTGLNFDTELQSARNYLPVEVCQSCQNKD